MTGGEINALFLSLRVALVATLIMMPLAVATAYVLSRKRFMGYTALNVLVFLPLVMPPVVTGYVLLILFGRNGSIGGILESLFGWTLAFNWTGAALASGIMAFPLMVRPIRQAFDAVDPGLEMAANALGASKATRWRTITLPLAAPGLIAAGILGFAKALGEFGATITFAANIPGQTQTLALAIHTELQRPGGEPAAFRLTLIALVIAIGAVVASEFYMARQARKWREDGDG